MNEETTATAELDSPDDPLAGQRPAHHPPPVPGYLQETYWWAYLHPRAVWLFEREWLVNLILWGQMRRLTDAVLAELEAPLPAPILQVACVYGDFSRRLARGAAASGTQLHLAEIAPIQLENARAKLAGQGNVRFHRQDSSHLHFTNRMFSRTVVFFLLHEQPDHVRRRTIAEAVRVTRPGGRVVMVDYNLPSRGNPLRYLMRPVLKRLEPFALDLWETPLTTHAAGSYQHRAGLQVPVWRRSLPKGRDPALKGVPGGFRHLHGDRI